jgi:uncharacterized protein (DUF2342 family)
MTLYRSARAIVGASGEGLVDWDAVATAAKRSTTPGSLDLSEAEIQGYESDVRDARNRLRDVSGARFDLPDTIQVQDRHHWIDANVATFRRVMTPFEEHVEVGLPGVARVLNTGSMSLMLGFLARNVLGQYDPLLLADDPADHELYFVRPNIVAVADELDVDYDRFRRWIAFHEVAHAAEFGAAPWLSDHLTEQLESGVEGLADGSLDRSAFTELQTAMTAVEGYAELLMDQAFDDEYADLRRKLDDRRGGQGPIGKLLRRALGLGIKERQYERGKAFFQGVAELEGLDATHVVWESPEHLPTEAELDTPAGWVKRVDP